MQGSKVKIGNLKALLQTKKCLENPLYNTNA